MDVVAEYLGRSEFEVIARKHRLICDQPINNNGSDASMTPPEFLVASLAACAGYYAAEYLKARGLSSANLKVRVTAEKALNPARLAKFDVEITVPELGERHRNGVLRAARACVIHNTLLSAPVINLRVNADERDPRLALKRQRLMDESYSTVLPRPNAIVFNLSANCLGSRVVCANPGNSLPSVCATSKT